ncbi:glucose 1-dehydrogenase [Iodidimonas sp. SYSU 1G8]|uniref:glucose 1-dehydrogenase n=1 Tax=Iodidimonas sp. SYSU 1G8 TaxID=3133967 RepID=UPI0031FF34F8
MTTGARLDGKVVLVTGAARGIGAAIAAAMVREGASVVLTDIREDAGRDTAAALGPNALFVRHDVTSEAGWTDVLDKAADRFGGVDVLVNNAGLFLGKPLAETSVEEMNRMLAVNVTGLMLGCKLTIPSIAARAHRWDGGGAIVNLSSVAGLIGASFQTVYSMTKGAVRLFSKSLAMECADLKQNIRVNSIHPGVIDTDMAADVARGQMDARGMDADKVRRFLIGGHPLGRLGTAKDIADAAVFLASSESAFMTGTELVVDGGMTAR